MNDADGEAICDSRGEERHVDGEHRPVDDVDQHWTRDQEFRLKPKLENLLALIFLNIFFTGQ